MTIVEFLLARIGEDEAVARAAMREWAPDRWAPASVYDDGVRDVAVALDPRRVLAECEAKRRIVNANPPHGWDIPEVLYFLAAVYADHPDYDTAWTLH